MKCFESGFIFFSKSVLHMYLAPFSFPFYLRNLFLEWKEGYPTFPFSPFFSSRLRNGFLFSFSTLLPWWVTQVGPNCFFFFSGSASYQFWISCFPFLFFPSMDFEACEVVPGTVDSLRSLSSFHRTGSPLGAFTFYLFLITPLPLLYARLL